MTITPRSNLSTAPDILDEGERLIYAGVCISSEAVFELDGKYVLLKIPRQEIRSTVLKRGSGAENPTLQVGFGALLATGGVAGTIPLLGGNYAAVRYEIAAMFFGVVGMWMLWEAARRHTYLLITTGSERRKIKFRGNVEPQKLAIFLAEANQRFGYEFPTTEV